jgi:hypothetical protein
MTPSTPTNERSAATDTSLPTSIRAAAFWLAVLLPFFVLALLASGLNTYVEYLFFTSLVVTNIAALVIGHGHGRE